MLLALLCCAGTRFVHAQDPLPSWNEGPTKAAIVSFVDRVTTAGGPDFVPVEQRIATFDNDGCLWSEKPIYFQLAFAIDRVHALAAKHPEWKTQQPFQAVLEGDLRAVAEMGIEGLLAITTASHAGMTTDEFAATVEAWLASARHPRFQRPYHELVFQPMLELLTYLRANGFKTYITSGGGIDFLRVFAEQVYGIPPEQVIGSSIKTKYVFRNGDPAIVRLPEIDFIDDKAGKPVGIQRHIGRRPIAAFGNSDGDLQMLQWTSAGEGARFCLLVHHTDDQREWAYDRDSSVGRLDQALDQAGKAGWTVVDMRHDWKVIYPLQRDEHHYFHKRAKSHAAEWGYAGRRGPDYWGDLDPSYALAKQGLQQSPIDIRGAVFRDLPEIVFHYKPSRVRLVYDGHTIQEDQDAGSFVTSSQHRFELEQFHFHSPSEHTIDGHQYPLEMHLVHKANDGSAGVVAVLFELGNHNRTLDPIWDNLPTANHPRSEAVDLTINVMDLLPSDHSHYSYRGSFTTPPCTEHVQWVVLKQPATLSEPQLKRFRTIIDGNNRPVQRLNGREILVSE